VLRAAHAGREGRQHRQHPLAVLGQERVQAGDPAAHELLE